MRHLLNSVKLLDLFKCVDARRQASMKAENLVLDNSSNWKRVEQVSEVLPHIRVTILSEAFVIEAVDLSDLSGLVISSEDCNSFSVSNFESNK